MCTISIAASAGGTSLRLLMNRDERRLRPAARPPAVHQTRFGAAIWPSDPIGGGTWVAVTSAGLAFALLNVDAHRRRPDGLSRGLVIPALADARSMGEVVERWSRLDTQVFAPFRLVAVSREHLAVCQSGEREVSVSHLGRAHLFASSALGDALVEPPRSELFHALLRQEADPWRAQTRLHHHLWPDRRHLSVMMSRVDACTVSQTEVVLAQGHVSLAYRPVVDGWPVGETRRLIASQPTWRAA